MSDRLEVRKKIFINQQAKGQYQILLLANNNKRKYLTKVKN